MVNTEEIIERFSKYIPDEKLGDELDFLRTELTEREQSMISDSEDYKKKYEDLRKDYVSRFTQKKEVKKDEDDFIEEKEDEKKIDINDILDIKED